MFLWHTIRRRIYLLHSSFQLTSLQCRMKLQRSKVSSYTHLSLPLLHPPLPRRILRPLPYILPLQQPFHRIILPCQRLVIGNPMHHRMARSVLSPLAPPSPPLASLSNEQHTDTTKPPYSIHAPHATPFSSPSHACFSISHHQLST